MNKPSLLAFYMDILEDRTRYSPKHGYNVLFSEISNEPIPQPSEWNFAHILTKTRWKDLKFERINVVVMTKEEHEIYDNSGKSKGDPRFDWVYVLKDYLKRKSHMGFEKRKRGY